MGVLAAEARSPTHPWGSQPQPQLPWRLLRGRALWMVRGKSSECAATMDVRASCVPRTRVKGCVCPVLIEGTETVVAVGLEGGSHYSVRRTGKPEIIWSLPSDPVCVCLLETITPP